MTPTVAPADWLAISRALDVSPAAAVDLAMSVGIAVLAAAARRGEGLYYVCLRPTEGLPS